MSRCELTVDKAPAFVSSLWRVDKCLFIQMPRTERLGIIIARTLRDSRQEIRYPRCPRHSYSSSLNLIFLLIIHERVRFVEIPLIFDYVS